MSGYALYKNEHGWFWVENDVQFGPYEEYWQCLGEKVCVMGCQKYEMLKTGQLKPRQGDTVKFRGLVFGGFVMRVDVHHFRLGYGVIIQPYMGIQDAFIPYDDVQWIAPVEWDS